MGFDDQFIYKEFQKDNLKKYMIKRLRLENELEAFAIWNKNGNKKIY